MKRGDIKKITIMNQNRAESTLEAAYLGRGSFVTCYEHEGIVYSFIKENNNREFDYSKEGIAEWADNNNIHVPDFNYMGTFDDGTKLYTSPLYGDLKASHKIAWSQYKQLKNAWESIPFTLERGYYKNNRIIDSLRDIVSGELIEALETINDSCSNYGDYYLFEFPKRNLKVDSDGNLILLDVIFNPRALNSYKS